MKQPSTFDRHAARLNLTGKTFGRLTALRWFRDERGVVWECRCSCGTVCVKTTNNLVRSARSCGCLRRETTERQTLRHGYARAGMVASEHNIWRGILSRCTNPNSPAYDRYGGRGIVVAEQWRGRDGFVTFLHDVGPRPSPQHTIDRINNDGGYEPGNVRWATDKQQARNQRTNRIIEYRGEKMTLAELSERCGVPPYTIHQRLRLGWDLERATTAPPTTPTYHPLDEWTDGERREAEDRFWAKVDRTAGPDACWPWRGSLVGGYGRFYIIGHGTEVKASRMAWEFFHGNVPKGKLVLHTCDVLYSPTDIGYRRCCNPAHLRLGTQKENLTEMSAKGRASRRDQ